MSNTNEIIGELSELNNDRRNTDMDMITIDLHDGILYIYSRFELWRGVIFKLDDIAKILIKYGCSFYLTDTRYGFPAISVTSI